METKGLMWFSMNVHRMLGLSQRRLVTIFNHCALAIDINVHVYIPTHPPGNQDQPDESAKTVLDISRVNNYRIP